jgi:hypothetical protein
MPPLSAALLPANVSAAAVDAVLLDAVLLLDPP